MADETQIFSGGYPREDTTVVTPDPTDTSASAAEDKSPDDSLVDPNAEDKAASEDAADEDKDKEVDDAEASDADADDTEDTAADEDADLTPEQLAELATTYKEQLLGTDDIKGTIEQRVQAEVTRQRQELERTQNEKQQVDTLVAQGYQAVTSIAEMAKAAQANFDKVKQAVIDAGYNAEAFESTILDPVKLHEHLRTYGSALVAEIEGRYDRAIEQGFDKLFTEKLPALSDEHAVELTKIVNTAQRMQGDPQQRAKAQSFFVDGLLTFLSDRSYEKGVTDARQEAESKKTVTDKVTNRTALKAAKAKLEKDKAPPIAGRSAPSQRSGDTLEEYQRLKREGKFDEAQSVVDRLSQQSLAASIS